MSTNPQQKPPIGLMRRLLGLAIILAGLGVVGLVLYGLDGSALVAIGGIALGCVILWRVGVELDASWGWWNTQKAKARDRQLRKSVPHYFYSDKEAILVGLTDRCAIVDWPSYPDGWSEDDRTKAECARRLAVYVNDLPDDDPRLAVLAAFRHPVGIGLGGPWPHDRVDVELTLGCLEPEFTFLTRSARLPYHSDPDHFLSMFALLAQDVWPPRESAHQFREYAEWVDEHVPGAKAMDRWRTDHPDSAQFDDFWEIAYTLMPPGKPRRPY